MNIQMILVMVFIIIVVIVFFIFGLDKVIIKPLVIQDYSASDIDKFQSDVVTNLLTTNSFSLKIY